MEVITYKNLLKWKNLCVECHAWRVREMRTVEVSELCHLCHNFLNSEWLIFVCNHVRNVAVIVSNSTQCLLDSHITWLMRVSNISLANLARQLINYLCNVKLLG